MSEEGWAKLGAIDPAALVDARLQIHWAGQVLAAVGETHVAHTSDTGHTNLGWDADTRAFWSHAGGSAQRFRAGLRPDDLVLLLDDGEGGQRSQLALPGLSLARAYEWAADSIAERSGGSRVPLVHPGFELPKHAVGEGAPFGSPGAAFGEIASWFAAGAAELDALDAGGSEISPTRTWPHHLDIARLLELERDAAGAATRSVGVGLSPGDDAYAEPYWYVNHWPGARGSATEALPELPAGGSWHREGWLGGVLTATALLEHPLAERGAAVRAFLETALDANRALAGADSR